MWWAVAICGENTFGMRNRCFFLKFFRRAFGWLVGEEGREFVAAAVK